MLGLIASVVVAKHSVSSGFRKTWNNFSFLRGQSVPHFLSFGLYGHDSCGLGLRFEGDWK